MRTPHITTVGLAVVAALASVGDVVVIYRTGLDSPGLIAVATAAVGALAALLGLSDANGRTVYRRGDDPTPIPDHPRRTEE